MEWREIDSSEDGERKFELNTAYRPVNRLTVEAADPVFSRKVRVEAPTRSTTGEDWRRVVSGRISKIAYRDLLEKNTTLQLQNLNVDRLRLVVEEESLRPLEVEELTAFGPQWRLVFLAEPDWTYRVGLTEEMQSSEASHVQQLLRQGYTPQRVLPLAMEGTPEEKSWSLTDFLKSCGFHIVAILVAGVVLGIGLFQGVKGLDADV